MNQDGLFNRKHVALGQAAKLAFEPRLVSGHDLIRHRF